MALKIFKNGLFFIFEHFYSIFLIIAKKIYIKCDPKFFSACMGHQKTRKMAKNDVFSLLGGSPGKSEKRAFFGFFGKKGSILVQAKTPFYVFPLFGDFRGGAKMEGRFLTFFDKKVSFLPPRFLIIFRWPFYSRLTRKFFIKIFQNFFL